jgi:hypothetical protein
MAALPEISFDKTDLPDGAARFFATFARFEFALKDQNFLSIDSKGTVAADWDRFAAEMSADFFGSIVASRKADTLLNNPPKKQIIVAGALDFKRQTKPKNVVELFVAIRRMRNNLFHGGKSGDPEGKERNEQLIAESQWTLEQALHAHDDLRWSFEGRY